MKKAVLLILIFIFNGYVWGQSDNSKLWDKILISQSMETAEQKEKPAQLQLTIPKKDSASWLVNLGVSYAISKNAARSISKVQAEYHKNTLTDKKQNNFQIGYGLLQAVSKNASKGFYLNADAKYVYDGVDIKNSIASNLLLSFYKDTEGGNGLNFNAMNIYGGTSLYLSAFGGLQIQEIFKANDGKEQGFIIRPQYLLSIYFDVNDHADPITPNPIIRLSIDYAGRVDAINTTYSKEHYTQLLKAGIDFFIAYNPVKVSIGGSFNYGSDPLAGLKQQQYWLLSLNFSRGR